MSLGKQALIGSSPVGPQRYGHSSTVSLVTPHFSRRMTVVSGSRIAGSSLLPSGTLVQVGALDPVDL